VNENTDQRQAEIEARLISAAWTLTRDVSACEGLLLGLPVARKLLDPAVLAAIGEPLDGEPIELSEELALRVQVGSPREGAVEGQVGRQRRHGSTRLSDVAAQRIRWLEPGLVPLRALTLLAGAGGLGKSTFAMRLAADLSRGRLLEDGEPGSTLIVSTEDTAAEILKPRARAADGDVGRIRHYTVPLEEGGMLVLPGDFEELELEIAESEPRLVIIDPILGTLDVALDSHKDQHVRSVLGRLSRLAEERDLAVVMVAHVNKATSRDAYIRVSGSVALYNAARSVLLVTADPENPESTEPGETEEPVSRIVSQHKANYSRRYPPRRYEIRPIVLVDELDDRGQPLESSAMVYIEDAAGLELADLLAEASPNGHQPKTAQAEELLADLLADGDWHDSAGLKKLVGAQHISEPTVKRAAQALGVESERRGFPASTWWRLPQSDRGLSPTDEPTEPTGKKAHEQWALENVDSTAGPVGSAPPGQAERDRTGAGEAGS
jgi:KaiC/GvpD/RAD55 family RecA-like ATPase